MKLIKTILGVLLIILLSVVILALVSMFVSNDCLRALLSFTIGQATSAIVIIYCLESTLG